MNVSLNICITKIIFINYDLVMNLFKQNMGFNEYLQIKMNLLKMTLNPEEQTTFKKWLLSRLEINAGFKK